MVQKKKCFPVGGSCEGPAVGRRRCRANVEVSWTWKGKRPSNVLGGDEGPVAHDFLKPEEA